MNVRLVLDTSGLLGYVADDIRALHVGELLTCVKENGDAVGVPALCLISACQRLEVFEVDRLLRLCRDGRTVVLDLVGEDTPDLIELCRRVGADRAHAVASAWRHEAMLGTYERFAYQKALSGEMIHDLQSDA